MPYLGEIKMFAGPFTPEGWKICAGQEMSVQQNQALYSIIGNQYGGDGIKVFNLPDLRNRFPMQVSMREVGKLGGATQYKIAPENLPAHVHTVNDPGHKHVVDLSPAPHTHSFAVPIANPGDGGGSIVGGYADTLSPASYSTASTPGSALGPGTTGPAIPSSGATATSGTTSTEKTGITVTGGNTPTQVPLTITPPSLAINFIICVEGGDYPPRSDD